MFTCDYLRLDTLTLHRGDRVGVTSQSVDVSFGSNVPNLQNTQRTVYNNVLFSAYAFPHMLRARFTITLINDVRCVYVCETHSGCSITTACHQDVDGGMEVQVVNSAQVTVVVTDNLQKWLLTLEVTVFSQLSYVMWELQSLMLYLLCNYGVCACTLLYSRSQHLTCLSSPQENRYGLRELTATPLTVLM